MKVGFGCVTIGSATAALSSREQIRLVQQAVDRGVDHFDTADAYGSGMSERLLGRALGRRREQVTISTKAGYVFRERSPVEQQARRVAARVLDALPSRGAPGAAPSTGSGSYQQQDFSLPHLRSAVEASLRRLNVEHIDVLLLHGPPTANDELFDGLNDLQASGKVGRFGVGAESIASAAAWMSVPGTEVIQLPFGPLDVAARAQVFEPAPADAPEFWARGVLGGGVLSAAVRDIDSVADHPKREQITALLDAATAAGMRVDELAIRWVLASEHVGLTILGMSSPDHLERNLELISRPPLPADIMELVETGLTASPDSESEAP